MAGAAAAAAKHAGLRWGDLVFEGSVCIYKRVAPSMLIGSFDWDEGNWPKCGKHGLTKEEIEDVFRSGPTTNLDPSFVERRFRAVGRTRTGRFAFVVFTFRDRGGRMVIRPISARYMHAKEIRRYEQTKA